MRYFKILSGFNDKEPISIDETELETAIRAQITGKIAVLKQGTIAGNSISKILPDFDKAKKIYNPAGEDYLPPSEKEAHHLAIENAGEVVKAKMENRPPQLKEPSVRIHTQGMKSIGDLLPK